MSIACFASHTRSTLDDLRADRVARNSSTLYPLPSTFSPRKLAANRRNAQKSTGPRTPEGKRRVSRNALKHGLTATFSHLQSECPATFNTFLDELREELQPRTALQNLLFNEIANLLWRLRRLPEAQSKIFLEELNKLPPQDSALSTQDSPSASDVLAQRFSADPSNGFITLARYERGMHNSLLRLLSRYHHLQKHHPTTAYSDPASQSEIRNPYSNQFPLRNRRHQRDPESSPRPPPRLPSPHSALRTQHSGLPGTNPIKPTRKPLQHLRIPDSPIRAPRAADETNPRARISHHSSITTSLSLHFPRQPPLPRDTT